ncbi:hypothetical protein RSAG8_11299, partial [Rhizoctonia solani AG-8 WAC10335]
MIIKRHVDYHVRRRRAKLCFVQIRSCLIAEQFDFDRLRDWINVRSGGRCRGHTQENRNTPIPNSLCLCTLDFTSTFLHVST